MNKPLLLFLVACPAITLAQERFQTLDSQTIHDTMTALVWQQAGSTEQVSFFQAEQYCADLASQSGLNWRLPKIKELATLIDENSYHPSIYPVFKTESRFYWSSTLNAADNDFAWMVNFSDSHIHSFRKQTPYYVRCVYSAPERGAE